MPISPRRTSASPWAASRPSSRSTTIESAGMEHGRGRPDQARSRRRADPPAARPLRAGRVAALRPGQMVSGRAAAALGVRALLAQGRQADLAEPGADRDREDATATRVDRRRASLHRGSLAARLGIAAEHVLPAFEDPAERMLKEGELPANVDPRDPEDRRSGRARAHHARASSALSAPTGYVLPVQRWTAQASAGWISEALAAAPRPAVPGAGRFADRLPAAARVAAAHRAERLAASGARPIRSPSAARCPIRPRRRRFAPTTGRQALRA